MDPRRERLEARKTHEQYVSDVKVFHPKIKVLSKYTTAGLPIDYKCLNCGREATRCRASLLISKGCGACNVEPRKKRGKELNRYTDAEYRRLVREVHGVKIKVLKTLHGEERVKDFGRIDHQCGQCIRIWQPYYAQVLKGHGCTCGNDDALARHRTKLKEIHGSNIKLLEFRTGDSIRPNSGQRSAYSRRSKYRCKCGYEWYALAETVGRGSGCQACVQVHSSGPDVRYQAVKINRKTFHVQGYEESAIRYLIEKYGLSVGDIHTYSSGKVPFITWSEGDNKRMHFPDILVGSLNTIFEVKSAATIGLAPFRWRKQSRAEMFYSVQKKANVAISQGYKYTVLLISSKRNGSVLKLPSGWLKMNYSAFREAFIQLNSEYSFARPNRTLCKT